MNDYMVKSQSAYRTCSLLWNKPTRQASSKSFPLSEIVKYVEFADMQANTLTEPTRLPCQSTLYNLTLQMNKKNMQEKVFLKIYLILYAFEAESQ